MTTAPPELPPALARSLRPVLPGLAEETIAAIGREVPEYARPLEGPFGRGVRIGVERALVRFVDRIADPGQADEHTRDLYVALGRGEMRAGRRLDVLLSAYRLGARLAWERFVAAAEADGHDPHTLYALAGAIFTYIDAISAESVEGFAEEQSHAAGVRARRRRALVRLLARDDVPAEEVQDLAAVAVWPLPASVAALVVPAAGDAERLASRLGLDVIAAAEEEGVVAFVPDPEAPGRRAQITAALQGERAVLGPAVAPARAHHSLARARAGSRLVVAGRLVAEPLVVAEEHLLELLLHAGDAALGAELAARALEPLERLASGPQARLAATLREWLNHPGQVQHVAGLLHVHPQTVRYRLRQLRELFGEALDDPEQRFVLGVALRVGGPINPV